MAAVRIDSGALPSAVGVEGNALMRVIGKWASIADGRFPEDCSALLQMVDETDRLRLWEKNIGGHKYKDRNEFLQRTVLIDFSLTEQALTDIVARLHRGETVTMRAQRIAQAVKPLRNEEGGRPRKDENHSDGIVSKPGNSAAYLAARLKRDFPEISAQLANGEFRSVRAAAIAAGIIKPKTPLEQIVKLLPKLTADELIKLKQMLEV